MQKELHSRENKMTKADARKAALRIAQSTIQQSIRGGSPVLWQDGGKLLAQLYGLINEIYHTDEESN